ncbi:MAG TPA: hypothetical protein DCG90_11345 [Sphingobium sp.]|jgi:hypothetical protein|uniref:hypothetical protein n=1 Tax=unclassified Sphingobium TaxID=2611147 RepID=UPI000EF12AD8|nr:MULTISPECIES: hypothetical protein [unclassified Sphingobium]WIW87387.1 hypothetical protein K3M67_10385 [Sphingobium sp. V4]HAF42341.1 hypothetical protein [Sphingobium sp.]
MKHVALAACLPILLLAACGRTEPVADMPTQEELAAAANAAAANAIASQQQDDAPESRNYVNVERGFSITLPEGWVMDKSASTADGIVYQDPGAGADVRVFWQKNDGDQTLQQIVESVSNGAEGVDGDFVGDNEYRGTANDGEGNNVAIRLLRQPDGSIVTATFVYPEMLSEQYQGIADRLLTSLRIFAPRDQAEAAAGAPGNAANAVAAP